MVEAGIVSMEKEGGAMVRTCRYLHGKLTHLGKRKEEMTKLGK